jgi:hypothetical protein
MMRQRSILIIVGLLVVVLAGGLVWLLTTSNILRTAGMARFMPGEDGMNKLEITGPAGWYCIEYTKQQMTANPSDPLELGGKGWSRCPLFGPAVIQANHYPDSGSMDNIALNQPVMIYQNEQKTYEVYLWFSQDLTVYDRLAEDNK